MAQPTLKDQIDKLQKQVDELTAALNGQYNELQERIANETGNGPSPNCWRALRISPVGGLYPFRSNSGNPTADDCGSEAEAIAYAQEQGKRFQDEVFTVVPVYHYDEKPVKKKSK